VTAAKRAKLLIELHIMISYNWDHQQVILRVVDALQSRGYRTWVDTEQMKVRPDPCSLLV